MGICDSPTAKQEIKYVGLSRAPKEEKKEKNLQLEFTLDNCSSGSKYYVMIEFLNTPDSFQTETVFCHQNMIIFNSTYICEYIFETPQLMRIWVFKNGQNIGSFTPFLGSIVGSPNYTFRAKLAPDKPEFIVISAKSMGDVTNLLFFNFVIRTNKNVDFNNKENKIFFMITSNYKKIYKSETISQYGQFKTTSILKELLEPQFEVTFFNYRIEKIVSKLENPDSFTGQNNQVY